MAMEDGFYIDEWLVEPSLNRISTGDRENIIEPRLMRILCRLAEQPGQVVQRDELMSSVWGNDVLVTENSLHNAISTLRRLFDDEALNPKVIQTIRSSGYRLIASVRLAQSAEPHLDDRAEPVVSPAMKRGKIAWTGVGLVVVLIAGFLSQYRDEIRPATPVEPGAAYSFEPLTSLQGVEYGPAFSPDGNRVAFVLFSPEGSSSDLYVQEIGSPSPKQLTDLAGGALYPAWSPDGRSIAFVWNRSEKCGIYVASSEGGSPEELLETNHSIRHLEWSPDGKYLVYAYVEEGSESSHIARFDFELKTVLRLTSPGVSENDHWPKYAPDGAYLAFKRMATERSEDLFLLDLSDPAAHPRPLTSDQSLIQGYAWLPDGQRVVYTSNREKIKGIWSIDIDTGIPALLRTAGSRDMHHFTIARKNERAAFVQETSEINLYQAEPDKEEAGSVFSPSTYAERQARYSPDAQTLVFVSNRSGYPEIWRARSAGDQLEKLTDLQNGQTARPAWSRDGQWIAFETGIDGQTDIFIVPTKGGEVTRLTSSHSNEVAPAWSADGQFLYFGSDESGSWEIWKMPFEGGASVQVTSDGGLIARESTDGQWLFLSKADPSVLYRMNLSTGEYQAIASSLINQSAGNFSVTGEAVFFINRNVEASRFELFRFSMIDERVSFVGELPVSPITFYYQWGLDVSSDEKQMIWAQIDRPESDIVLINNFR